MDFNKIVDAEKFMEVKKRDIVHHNIIHNLGTIVLLSNLEQMMYFPLIKHGGGPGGR